MSHHHVPAAHLSPADKEHLIKGELIHHLSPFYDFHPHSLFQSLVHRLFHSHDHALVEVGDFQPTPLESLSQRQRLRRAVFALKKIKEFNHHFFNDEELRVLNPWAPGFISYALLYSGVGLTTAFSYWAWRSWTMNPKTFLILGGLLATNSVLARTPNYCNEMIQNYRRRQLARKYIKVYGEEFLNEIVNPKFDIEKIREMHNLARRLD